MNKKQILNFTQAVRHLSILNRQIANFLSSLRIELQNCKTANLPIIGNPLLKIFNDTIKLNYASLLLKDNCIVYKELINDDIEIDHSFLLQLDGMVLHIKEAQKEYDIISSRFNNLREIENTKFSFRLTAI